MRRTTLARDDVEGVGARPRGVRRAVVERVEVVVDGLDLGTFHDREAEAEEDVFELALRGGEHVQAPDRLRRGAGQRHVDAVAPPAARSSSAARARPRAPRSAPRAPRAPRWRPCRRRPAARARARPRRAAAAAARPCVRGSAPAAPRAASLVAAAAISPLGLRAQLFDPLDHDARTLDGQPVSSYSATVAAIAAFSESPAIGMCATRSHAPRQLLRQPLALGADEQRQRPPRPAHGWAARLAARRGDQRDALARELRSAHARERDARRSRPCSRAPPSASAGRRSRGRAPRRRRRRPGRSGAIVPTLPGSRTPVQVHAQRPQRALAPALLVDADHARARPERARPPPAPPARPPRKSCAAEPAAGGAIALDAASTPARPRPRAGPRPRRRSGRCARARGGAAGAAAPSGGGSVGSDDGHRCVVYVDGVFDVRSGSSVVLRHKKGAVLEERRPGGFDVGGR